LTGVPRASRDEKYSAALERGDYGNVAQDDRYEAFAAAKPVEATNIPPMPEPTPVIETPPPQRRRVRTQVRRPDPEKDDPGQILEGYCDVRGGLVYVWGDTGSLTARHRAAQAR
jgi:hypothetical protein